MYVYLEFVIVSYISQSQLKYFGTFNFKYLTNVFFLSSAVAISCFNTDHIFTDNF